jgi:uncharacterized membrane protein YccC
MKVGVREKANWLSSIFKSGWVPHSARPAVAAAVSFAVAGLFRMPESYWAAVSTIIVTQSTLGAAWATSRARIVGTALGAGLGCLLASCSEPRVLVFVAGIFVLGLICGMLRLDQSAYRFAGITLAIVTLVARAQAPTLTAVHRFVEVSIGIAVALALSALWPGREPSRAG